MAIITKISPFAPKEYPVLPQIQGVSFQSLHCGIKKRSHDLLVVSFERPASVAGVFTQSTTAAAPVLWCRHALESGTNAMGLVVNSGNANAFTGLAGEQIVQNVVSCFAQEVGCSHPQVYMCSTGVIGQTFDSTLITNSISNAIKDGRPANFLEMAQAIITTDTFPKVAHSKVKVDSVEINICGIAKGSGMIEPNMATMLAFIFTDANISSAVLQEITSELNEETFNTITVDSDTSTNDTLLVFATKAANNKEINSPNMPAAMAFKAALKDVMLNLAQQIVKDGEGATKFIEIEVDGASDGYEARHLAKTIANSPLVKTAIHGGDANWGRIIMALGKSGVIFNQKDLLIKFGNHVVVKGGTYNNACLDADLTSYIVDNSNIQIYLNLASGKGHFTAYTCDFSNEYININAKYRS